MTLDDITNYYKSTYKFANDTGINSGAWSRWQGYGYVPARSQLIIEYITGGELVADLDDERELIKRMAADADEALNISLRGC